MDTEIVEEKRNAMPLKVPDFLAETFPRLDWLKNCLQLELAVLDVIWRAVVACDCVAIEQFLAESPTSAGALSVDFKPFRGSYESRIFCHGIMPMRPSSVHDYLNLMTWKNFPRSKATINRLHFEHIAREANGRRGPQRDFLTILDEAGIVIFVQPETDCLALGNQLRAYRQAAEAADEWQQSRLDDEIFSLLTHCGAQIAVFGHALTEALVSRAHTLAITGAFSVIIPQGVRITESGLVDLVDADKLLEEFLCSSADDLRPGLFPSLRLDVVFEFITKEKQKNSPG